jgi:preprotein translocase subunit Sec61beta
MASAPRQADGESASPPDDRQPSIPAPTGRPATLPEVIKAVFWSFFGVRRGDAMRQDALTIRPRQVIVVGIALAALVVLTLLLLVQIVLHVAAP